MTTTKQPSEKALAAADDFYSRAPKYRTKQAHALALDAFAAEAVKVEREARIAAIRASGKE